MNSPEAVPAQNPAPAPSSAPAAISLAQIRSEQKFGLSVAVGLGAALGGAVLWAVVTVITQMELGLMSVAIGYLVGNAIKVAGKGIDKKFQYLGAVCGLIGCVLGNLLSVVSFYADSRGYDLAQLLSVLDFDLVERLAARFFRPMDFLFYAIGVYEAYKFSLKYRVLKKAPAPQAAASLT